MKLYTLIGAMVTFFSLNYIVARFALREFPPMQLTAMRTAIAAVILLALWGGAVRRRPKLTRHDLISLALLGIFGVTLNQLLFAFGLQRTSVAHASLLSALAPIMVLLIAPMIGQERITIGKLAGMAIAVAGVAVLQMDSIRQTVATLTGDALILLSALAIALYSVIGKRVTARHDIITVNAVSYLTGFIALLPLLLPPHSFSYAAVSAEGWLSLLYMAVFPSVLGYLIYCYALTRMPASRVSAFSYLQPLLATILGVPMLGEPVTGSLAGGGALVLVGVYVTERG